MTKQTPSAKDGVSSEPNGVSSPTNGTSARRSGTLRALAIPSAATPTGLPTAQVSPERVLRVAADSLNRLLGLAGEALVESRWLPPYSDALLRTRRRQGELASGLESFRASLGPNVLTESQRRQLDAACHEAATCTETLAGSHEELEGFVRRSANLSGRLYREAQLSRMRPFADRAQGFPRFVRDLAGSLGKSAHLRLVGANTQVDRDILEKLEAPLTHLLRNALDHGLESPEERQRAGKPPEGTLTLETRHSAGMLIVVLTDDGRGIDLENLRSAIVQKKLTTHEAAARMSEEELLEFLFLPGFSTRDNVTELSGRGVGLDVVRSMVKEVRGSVRLTSQTGRGTRCALQLPLTLSVLRALIVEIGGEPYALPLARIARTLRLPRAGIETLEGRQHFALDGQAVGLVAAHQVLELDPSSAMPEELAVVVLGEHGHRIGVVVDQFLGERELVVQTLDPRLGKLKNISAAAILADRAPVLIVDVDDLLRSVELLATGSRLGKLNLHAPAAEARRRQRVLVVDDSLTVREMERKLLLSRGYEVEVAVDGMDGWNTLRAHEFDLLISDVDMPRMDGIELIGLVKKDARLRALPVMIVSYKDREEDRRRGLDAGADYYLTKSSFHDESLLRAVADLIGGGGRMRIAIVNDLPMAVEALRRALIHDPAARHQFAWVARNGIEAVQRCAEDLPDLVLMDLIMPDMDGVEATRRIMTHTPCAILLVSAHAGTQTGKIFEAMGVGALDVVASPVAGQPPTEFLAKIETMRRYLGSGRRTKAPLNGPSQSAGSTSMAGKIVAIGSSAGGPPALAELLGGLSADFSAPVIIVQHLDEKFAPGLAEWLNQQTPLSVRLARSGDSPRPGTVLLAGKGDHLVFTGPSTLGYTPDPVEDPYRPSVDVFFESAARQWPGNILGVLLTGMGRDGAKGLKTLREKGFHTIAQDQASSAIYGMPKQAAAIGAAVEILPLKEIASALWKWTDH